MPGKNALWLEKRFNSLKRFCILMIVLGVPGAFFLVKKGFLAGDDAGLYYFFYLMGWVALYALGEVVLRPSYLRTYRKDYIAFHSDLPEEQLRAVAEGKVIKGMSAETASAATGRYYREAPDDSALGYRLTSKERAVKGTKL